MASVGFLSDRRENGDSKSLYSDSSIELTVDTSMFLCSVQWRSPPTVILQTS